LFKREGEDRCKGKTKNDSKKKIKGTRNHYGREEIQKQNSEKILKIKILRMIYYVS